MLKKGIVGIPLLALVGLFAFVISINQDSSDSARGQEEKMAGTEAANFDSSESALGDPREYGHPIEKSRFGEPKDFVLAIHSQWNEMDWEEQYAISATSQSFDLISSLVTEINYLRTNIDGALSAEFDALQETANKITHPDAELSEKELKSLIPLFENQLNKLYGIMMNR